MKLLGVATTLLAAALPVVLAQSQPCVSGLHMIVARASLESPGTGIIGAVAREVKKKIANSSITAVRYPATENHYYSSEHKGVVAMNKLVMEYIDNCKNAKVALFGYSQGAQVLGDVLCGTSESGFTKSPALPKNYSDHIVAGIQMGDPSFVPKLPYDRGTSKKHGLFPRHDTKACLPYTSRLRSFCNKNDLFCASGTSLAVHLRYVQEYGKASAAFVVDKYNALKK